MNLERKRKDMILIVDDEADLLTGLARALARRLRDLEIVTATGGAEALTIFEKRVPDLVLLDVMMGEVSGMEVLDWLHRQDRDLTVIMMTAFGSIELAVDSIRRGAWDFVTKPLDLDGLARMVEKGLERNRLVRDNRRLLDRIQEMDRTADFVGESPPMRCLYKTIEIAAATDYTVLIRGASGTGKELAARALHGLSKRKNKPLVMVNCPAIPEQLLESELFGHRRGSFTGAERDHDGLFVQADGGTICLDEIGDIPVTVQAKLLRVLQDKKVKALGAHKARSVDVRILASTNRDLEEKIRNQSFREDLFYRLNVVTLHTPCLDEIREDIPLLANHFLRQACAELECGPKTLALSALDLLTGQSWPGNVRQLQNCIRRAVMFCPGEIIAPENLISGQDASSRTPDQGRGKAQAIKPYKEAKEACINDFTNRYVTNLLRKTSGNISEAARLSGLTRAALQKILRRQGITGDQFRKMAGLRGGPVFQEPRHP